MLAQLLLFVGTWIGTAHYDGQDGTCRITIEDVGGTIRTTGRCDNDQYGSVLVRGRLSRDLDGDFFSPSSVGLTRSNGLVYAVDGGFAIEADYTFQDQTERVLTVVTWPVNGTFSMTSSGRGLTGTMTFTIQ